MWVDARERFPELYWWKYELSPEKFRKMYYKLENDPRLTRVGKWLRKTTLDELPNFLSVLRRDVRLVGPRPEVPELQAYYTEEQMLKFTVKPGITCLSKVHGRGELSVQEQIELDLEYVRTRTLALDLKIMFLTVVRAFTGRGAF
jgi:lipopolysaccharide/colanic/teichoic acid biosynthesis glycosyltransferase